MIIVDLNLTEFSITLTLGNADTLSPPPLLLGFYRHGTNESFSYTVPLIDVTTGLNFLTIDDIPTSIFPESGQYELAIMDNTAPATPILLEKHLVDAYTTPITKKDYGTDKERGEYKGHI